MAVPDTDNFSEEDVINELSLTGSDKNLVKAFDVAISSYFDPRYDKLKTGSRNDLYSFRNYGNVPVSPEVNCLSNLKIIVAYKYAPYNTDPNHPPGWEVHECNRAEFDVFVNNIYIGTAHLNNFGGPLDKQNRFPNYPNYLGADYSDRYNEFNIGTEMAIDLAAASASNNLEVKIVCSCSSSNCSHGTQCHSEISWLRIYRDEVEVYNGYPLGNTISNLVVCTGKTYVGASYRFWCGRIGYGDNVDCDDNGFADAEPNDMCAHPTTRTLYIEQGTTLATTGAILSSIEPPIALQMGTVSDGSVVRVVSEGIIGSPSSC